MDHTPLRQQRVCPNNPESRFLQTFDSPLRKIFLLFDLPADTTSVAFLYRYDVLGKV